MKNIFTSLLLVSFLGLVSCELDQESSDSIPFDKAFTSMGTVEALELGAYSRLRTAFSQNSMIVPDLQADYAHAVYGFSNTYGPMYQWSFTQGANEVKFTWDDFYQGISHYNFVIDGIDGKLEFVPTEAEQLRLEQIKGTMYLMRALSYSVLAERFCADYDASTAKEQYSGLPLVTTYDSEQMPSRSTLYEVYERILEDLSEARKLLVGRTGSPDATMFNIDCVTALEARVLLQTDQYGEALKKANSLLAGPYKLVDSKEELQRMWMYDQSPETIFQFYASEMEVAYQWGSYFWRDQNNGMDPAACLIVPDYIPTQACLDRYAPEDWRLETYFRKCTTRDQDEKGRWVFPLIVGHNAAAESAMLFYKYPGNPELRTTEAWNYYNTYKVFRLAEVYLIAAEAAVQSGGDAKTPLNELRRHRGLGDLSSVTLADVQEERYREMLMEGTRLTDLKRWGMGMKRGKAQEADLNRLDGSNLFAGSIVTELGSTIEKQAGDYMFVWPIPNSEISANQQLQGQQNPGWKR